MQPEQKAMIIDRCSVAEADYLPLRKDFQIRHASDTYGGNWKYFTITMVINTSSLS